MIKFETSYLGLLFGRNMLRIYRVVVVVGLMTCGLGASAAKILVAGIDYAPMSIHQSTSLSGLGIDVIRKMNETLKLELEEIPIAAARLTELNESRVALFPIVNRSPEREAKGFRWVGQLFEDKYCFFTLKGSPKISSIEDAGRAKSIGVTKGGSTEIKAQSLGLSNLEIAAGNSGNVRKLFARKIDAWFNAETVGRYSIRSEGKDPSSADCVGDFGKLKYWIAASKEMDQQTFEKIKAAFDRLEKDGKIRDLVQKYTEVHQ